MALVGCPCPFRGSLSLQGGIPVLVGAAWGATSQGLTCRETARMEGDKELAEAPSSGHSSVACPTVVHGT